jgi:hypothetical protein
MYTGSVGRGIIIIIFFFLPTGCKYDSRVSHVGLLRSGRPIARNFQIDPVPPSVHERNID